MDEKPRPTLTPEAHAEQQARQDRLASALRANLRRRKEQARARSEPVPPEGAGPGAAPPASEGEPDGGAAEPPGLAGPQPEPAA